MDICTTNVPFSGHSSVRSGRNFQSQREQPVSIRSPPPPSSFLAKQRAQTAGGSRRKIDRILQNANSTPTEAQNQQWMGKNCFSPVAMTQHSATIVHGSNIQHPNKPQISAGRMIKKSPMRLQLDNNTFVRSPNYFSTNKRTESSKNKSPLNLLRTPASGGASLASHRTAAGSIKTGVGTKQSLTLEQVTPELAAQIVKFFILPMFETPQRKNYRRNAQKTESIQSRGGPHSRSSSLDHNNGVSSSILQQLHLSDALGEELGAVRSTVTGYVEQIEALNERHCEDQILMGQIKQKLLCTKKQIQTLNKLLYQQTKQKTAFVQHIDQQQRQNAELVQLVTVSEQLRSQFGEQLRQSKQAVDEMANQNYNLKVSCQMNDMAVKFMQESFQRLHGAIDNIAFDKLSGEKLERSLQTSEQSRLLQKEEIKQLVVQQQQLITERDDFRQDAKDLYDDKVAAKKQTDSKLIAYKEKISTLEDKIKFTQKEADISKGQVQTYEKTLSSLQSEKEKLKARINKLITRKGKVDTGIKACRVCGKEFIEKENFNWSCRTHQSDWGGLMWWCCGKKGKEQPGCKFSKHLSKEEDADLAGGQMGQTSGANMKYVRCACCRELGHRIEMCPHDPNLRTLEKNQDSELDRIRKNKDFRKLHADTLINTTHMIKKAVMVPLETDDEGEPIDREDVLSPFNRGVMAFDDYNYKLFNEFVLVQGPQVVSSSEVTSVQQSMNTPLVVPITDEKIEKSTAEHYEHDALTVKSQDISEYTNPAFQALSHEQQVTTPGSVKQKPKEGDLQGEPGAQEPVDAGKLNKVLGELEEADGQQTGQNQSGFGMNKNNSKKSLASRTRRLSKKNASDYLYKVYFTKSEIRDLTRAQQRDTFAEILEHKQQLNEEQADAEMSQPFTKVNLNEHIPLPNFGDGTNLKKRSTLRRSIVKRIQDQGYYPEFLMNIPNVDEYLHANLSDEDLRNRIQTLVTMNQRGKLPGVKANESQGACEGGTFPIDQSLENNEQAEEDSDFFENAEPPMQEAQNRALKDQEMKKLLGPKIRQIEMEQLNSEIGAIITHRTQQDPESFKQMYSESMSAQSSAQQRKRRSITPASGGSQRITTQKARIDHKKAANHLSDDGKPKSNLKQK